jgi:2-polyprenyl-3-methyl-5-hydroxy-6-metoxy-1,4-benzoquinol methylase
VWVDPVELATVKELVRLDGRRVVEVGCGDGRFTSLYAHEAEYVLGIDPKRAEIARARRERSTELAQRVQFRVAKTVARPRQPFDVALFSWSL